MTELFERMYPVACAAGVDSVRYWDMTYGEIRAAIDAFTERQQVEQERVKTDMQMQSIVAYRQAHLIGLLVSRLIGGKSKVPSLDEAFPGVFPEEMLKPRQQDWRVMKERIQAYADWHRKKRGERHGYDHRRTASADSDRDETDAARTGPHEKGSAPRKP